MPDRFELANVNLTAGEESVGARESSDAPFFIAILGDFTGRTSRGICRPEDINTRRAIQIDRDNFEDVLSMLNVELRLGLEPSPVVLRFSELEDFHPDQLFQRVALFKKLRDIRRRLKNPSTFPEAAEEFGVIAKQPHSVISRTDERSNPPPKAGEIASGSFWDEMIEATEGRLPAERSKPTDAVHEFARQLSEKYSVASQNPCQQEALAGIDRAISQLMRALLHTPDLQALEAQWRSVFLLVRRVDTGPKLKIVLLDISKDELTADLLSHRELCETGIHRLIVESGTEIPGGNPWSLIVGSYRFGSDNNDSKLLSRLARIADRSRAPFLAEASPLLLGCDSLASKPHPRDWQASGAALEGWCELRGLPQAKAIGLAIPRLLLRLPYGRKTLPTELFDFEEFDGEPEHRGYLWGNPAFAIATLLAQSFSEAGWQMRPGMACELTGLPLHIYDSEGASCSKACAEILLSDLAIERILNEGLIPLISYQNRDSVRVGRFQSITHPSRGLAGRWTE